MRIKRFVQSITFDSREVQFKTGGVAKSGNNDRPNDGPTERWATVGQK